MKTQRCEEMSRLWVTCVQRRWVEAEREGGRHRGHKAWKPRSPWGLKRQYTLCCCGKLQFNPSFSMLTPGWGCVLCPGCPCTTQEFGKRLAVWSCWTISGDTDTRTQTRSALCRVEPGTSWLSSGCFCPEPHLMKSPTSCSLI